MKYQVTEREKFVPDYEHKEVYDTYEEAKDRMNEMYRQVAIEGDPEFIEVASIWDFFGYVTYTDGNEVSWDIDEIDE